MIHVVAAAVTDAAGRVLIAQRPPGKHLAGGWEFPGGKLEAGEARRTGLARELREELGIVIREPRPLMRLRHTYEFGDVLIDMWVVTRYDGVPRGLDGQALRWCTQDELGRVDLLPADGPLVRALRLPEHLALMTSPEYLIDDFASGGGATITTRDGRLRGARCGESADALCAAARGDVDFLVMRRRLPGYELDALCSTVTIPVYTPGMELTRAWSFGASGVSGLA